MNTLTLTKPKLGFSGVGWIGKSRLQAISEAAAAEISLVSDQNQEVSEAVRQECGGDTQCSDWETLLKSEVDGIIIATPSAMHARQSIEALQHGKAVFCQKPLGRIAQETREVVQTAQEHNLLLSVDYSYRFTEAGKQLREVIHSGEIGEVFSASLVFHNAYGPDKSWYYQMELGGGGCLIDLGIHLVDMIYWIFDAPEVENVCSSLFSQGKAFDPQLQQVEDFASAHLQLQNGPAVDLQCSWNLPAGQDAVIEATFFGTQGGVSMKNIDGSFYDFKAELLKGTQRKLLCEPPDDWGGRAAVDWTQKLSQSKAFDEEAWNSVRVAEVIDSIYQRELR
jgi:predicted dehydrogenase